MSAIDDLLDTTLDDLEDLPEFKPFPPGAHKVLATFVQEKINDSDAIKLDLKIMETIELVNPDEDEPPKEGDESGTIFLLDNEYGRGNLKRLSAPFKDAMGLTTIRSVIEEVKNIECIVITGIRKDKNDPDKKYLDVKEISVI